MHPSIREAREADVERIHQLVVELAEYERSPEQVRSTPEQLRSALFGAHPAVYALVAEAEGEVVGFALYFLNFSTWEGVHGIYLEDLYVQPIHRGSGLGKALLRTLAAIAVERGYARFEWWVLDWNTPSIDFYRGLGAVAMDEWTVYRLTGDALAAAGSVA
jgi:GNAT superfamily N-acetyltransferase